MESFELVIELEMQSITLHRPSGPLPAIDLLIVTMTDSKTGALTTRPRLRLPIDIAEALRDQLTLTLAHIETSRGPAKTSH